MLGALAAVGIDFSVPEADITDWATNREFTPYPALAEALLTRLSGNRLRRPVFLDVIAFNYEHTLGVPSPRAVEQVRVGVLEAAVLEGSNTRHGERAAALPICSRSATATMPSRSSVRMSPGRSGGWDGRGMPIRGRHARRCLPHRTVRQPQVQIAELVRCHRA